MAAPKIGIYLTGGLAFSALIFLGGIYTNNSGFEWVGIGMGFIIILVGVLSKIAR
jgi:hypothetical protein